MTHPTPIAAGDKVTWTYKGQSRIGTVVNPDYFDGCAFVKPDGGLPYRVPKCKLTRLDAAEPASPRVADEGGDFSGAER